MGSSGLRDQINALVHNFPALVDESQRDSGLQPKVARHELPWEDQPILHQPRRGCVTPTIEKAATPLGLRTFKPPFSQGSSRLATLGCMTQSLWDWLTDMRNCG